uniref:Uncharacterized protein n=1 Tax=Arundo donax TaxID=35708 RepID=A0A0A9C6E1_ARUDO
MMRSSAAASSRTHLPADDHQGQRHHGTSHWRARATESRVAPSRGPIMVL